MRRGCDGARKNVPEIVTRAEAKARGLKRYFTGRPCKRGHICERYVNECICLHCNKETAIRRYHKNRRQNPEAPRWRKARAYNREYSAKVRDLIAALRKEMPELLKVFGL